MIETLNELINKEDTLIVFGYGRVGNTLIDYIQTIRKDIKIVVCDNSKEKQSENHEVRSVEDTVKEYPGLKYIIANLSHYIQMRDQLLSLGIADNNIFGKNIQNELRELKKKADRKRSVTPLEKIPFEVHLTEHCNLNCEHCAHFSSIAEEQYTPLGEFERDMERLAFLLNGISGEIHLLGGEPLLNKEIIRYIEITRKCFPESTIGIVTNGILLDKMEQEFWDACRVNKIALMVTQYPIRVKYEELLKRAETENVKFIFFRNTDNHCYMHKYPLDLQGKQDARESFMNCEMSNKCILLKKGKLYTCSVAGNIEHFNAFFDKELMVSESDYIDIYKVDSKETIARMLATPIPFCRYCDVNHRTFNHEWSPSKKQISEWIEEDMDASGN